MYNKIFILIIYILTFTYKDAFTNLLQNPGFEFGTVSWNISSTNVIFSTESSRVFNGRFSGELYMRTADTGETYIYQTVSVSPETVYTASGYFYDADFDKEVAYTYIKLCWLDSNNIIISTHTSQITVNTSNWQYLTTGRIIPPSNSVRVTFCIVMNKIDNSTSKRIYIDDVSLVKLGPVKTTDKPIPKNFPNPFNPRHPENEKTIIKIPETIFSENFEIRIYSLSGDLVRTLNISEWDGKDSNGNLVPAGMYFYIIRTDKGVVRGKMTVIK